MASNSKQTRESYKIQTLHKFFLYNELFSTKPHYFSLQNYAPYWQIFQPFPKQLIELSTADHP